MFTSALIISVEHKAVDLSVFENCLTVCCQHILAGNDGVRNGQLSELKTQCATIFSRFYLLQPTPMTEYITSRVDIRQFLGGWLQCMSKISSKKASRINSFAVLACLMNLPIESIYDSMAGLLEQTITDIIFELEGGKNEKPSGMTQRQKRMGHFSVRKEELRKLQLFEDQRLLQVFKAAMKTISEKLASKSLGFPPVSPVFQEKASFLMNSQC